MNDRGRVIIIPDERKIIQDEYQKKINKSHLEALREFSNIYKLGYDFQNGDYQTAPILLGEEGHLILKTLDDSKTAIFYMPELVTERQIMWLEYNGVDYRNYDLIGAFLLNGTEEPDQITGYLNVIKEARKRNRKYMKEVDGNVLYKI